MPRIMITVISGQARAAAWRLLPTVAGAMGVAHYARALDRRPAWEPPHGHQRRAGPLAVRVVGRGPPILLLHGLVGSGRFWGATYDALGAERRLIVPDLLGFGRSHRPEHGYAPADHAQAVVDALEDLGVDEPAVVGAHSLGSVIALRLAASHPARVAAIVAFGPPLYPDRRAARRRIGAAGPMAKLFVLPGSAAERACRWVCDHRAAAGRVARWTHPSLPPPLADDAVEHSWQSYSETMERCLLTAEPASWVSSLEVSVRLIHGTDDRVVDSAFVQALPDRNRHLRAERWLGDHRLPLTAPDRCRAAIASAAAG